MHPGRGSRSRPFSSCGSVSCQQGHGRTATPSLAEVTLRFCARCGSNALVENLPAVPMASPPHPCGIPTAHGPAEEGMQAPEPHP